MIGFPGFGPVYTQLLLDWLARIEARFAYDPNTNQLDRDRLAPIKAEIATKDAELRRRLAEGPRRLTTEAGEILARRRVVDPQLQRLYEKRIQAEADLKLFGQSLRRFPRPR